MKSTLPSLIAVAVLAGLLSEPKPALAQSKEVIAITSLQRDVVDLMRRIEEQKSGQDGRSAQIEALLKQLMDANAALTGELKSIQEAARKSQTDQQTKVIEPLSAVKIGMEDVSGSVAGLQANLNTMRGRQEKMESTLNDLKAAISIVLKQTEQMPQPTPVTTAAPSTADAAATLFAQAQSDRLEGKADFAVTTFLEIGAKYPESPLAPKAVYEAGLLYAENEQYTDAMQAFDRVLEQFPDNPMRKNAQFKKAEQLASLGKRADAAKEYTNFTRQYPTDDKAAEARDRAKALTAPAPAPAKPKAKGKSR